MLLAARFCTLCCVAALFALDGVAAKAARAGDATYLPPDAGHCEIFRVLSHDLPGECRQTVGAPRGLKTRSIKVHPPKPSGLTSASAVTAPLIEEGQDVETAEEPDALSLAMRIQFHYDSAILTDEAQASLDGIAAVLNSTIMLQKIVLLEGHADAIGSDDYNLSLSIRRAQAVQSYLISVHQIADWRLPFLGKGETELYDKTTPGSSVNRRVEFTNITG